MKTNLSASNLEDNTFRKSTIIYEIKYTSSSFVYPPVAYIFERASI